MLVTCRRCDFLPEITMSFACFSLLEVEATPRIKSLFKLDCSIVAFEQVKKKRVRSRVGRCHTDCHTPLFWLKDEECAKNFLMLSSIPSVIVSFGCTVQGRSFSAGDQQRGKYLLLLPRQAFCLLSFRICKDCITRIYKIIDNLLYWSVVGQSRSV